MNLSFDLQLFAVSVVSSGISYSASSKEFTLGDVELNDTMATASPYIGFNAGTVAGGLGVGNVATAVDSTKLVVFEGTNAQTTIKGATLGGSGAYKWALNASTLDKLELGEKNELTLIKSKTNLDFELGGNGDQTVTFNNSSKINLGLTNATTLKGDVTISNVSDSFKIRSGSGVQNLTVSGVSGSTVSLASKDGGENLINLKGSNSEAFVTVGGATGGGTVKSSEISGFKSIVFDAQANANNAAHISLGGGVHNSAVSILGSTGADTVEIGSNVNSGSSILLSLGGGNDTVTLSGTGYETIALATGHGTDTVTNWAETDGRTDKGNTISLAGAISTFMVHTVTGGYADVSVGGNGSANGTTLHGSTNTNNQLGVNLITKEDTYSALLVGSAALSSLVSTKFDNFGYIIADSNKTLNLGDTSKKKVVLANTIDTKHWDDNNVYQNVTTVIGSSAGKSLIINGGESGVSIYSAGSNDSIWGGANSTADSLGMSGNDKNVSIFTGKDDGLDVLADYAFGTTKAKSNVVRFLDGVEYIAAGNRTVTMGADDANALAVTFKTAGDNKIAYAFGSDGEKYIAGVDASSNGGSIAYGSDVSVYIGQGDRSTIVASSGDEVKLGWDGGAGYVSVGGIDATLAKEGSVVVGTTEYAQSITGSARGASSISGGFVADKWTDDNADILTGGGNASKSTTFFVGEKMGKDEIYNLSSKDNIVFLGSKYEDLVNFKPDASDTSLTFKFSSGNSIDASLVSGKTMKGLSDVSLYFDDGTYVWNGTAFEKAE